MSKSRVVLFTGAAGGIDSLIVNRFLAHGDTVIATDSSRSALHTLVCTRGPQHDLVTVTAEVDLGVLADLVRDRAGHLDVIINAAGYLPIVSFEDMTVDQWRQVIDINLTGTFLLTRAAPDA